MIYPHLGAVKIANKKGPVCARSQMVGVRVLPVGLPLNLVAEVQSETRHRTLFFVSRAHPHLSLRHLGALEGLAAQA